MVRGRLEVPGSREEKIKTLPKNGGVFISKVYVSTLYNIVVLFGSNKSSLKIKNNFYVYFIIHKIKVLKYKSAKEWI